HPYAGYLDFHSNRHDDRVKAFYQIANSDYKQVGFMEQEMKDYVEFWRGEAKRREGARRVVARHADAVYPDLVRSYHAGFLRSSDGSRNRETAALLRSVSPRMPAIVAALVDIDWK